MKTKEELIEQTRRLAKQKNAVSAYMATDEFPTLTQEQKDLIYNEEMYLNRLLNNLGKQIKLAGGQFSHEQDTEAELNKVLKISLGDTGKEIAHLIGSIFYYGDFTAETFNEKKLEELLRLTGFLYKDEESLIKNSEQLDKSFNIGNVSDGYHTFNELYEHRCTLYALLLSSHRKRSWMSKKHHDGTEMPGWFIAGMNLPTGDITYHLPEKMWDMLERVGVPMLEKGKEWDGHTSPDVVKRITDWVIGHDPYYYLEEGEIITEGCEFQKKDRSWHKCRNTDFMIDGCNYKNGSNVVDLMLGKVRKPQTSQTLKGGDFITS